ncbi:MAG: desulfoferrodoxin family protein [Candidatus Thiodiazotropha sp.]|jgi:superoxide reductase
MNRRDFLITTTSTAAVAMLGNNAQASESVSLPPKNLIFTQTDAGVWEKKKGTHIPDIEVKDGKVTITTNHSQSASHYIVRHTLLLSDGTVVGSKTFSHDNEPVSEYELPAGFKGKLFATSFCNKHDLWLADTVV